jgi:tetratricopeptide (TPR) repeat protein
MVLLRTLAPGSHRRAPARAALAVGLAMAWLVAAGQIPERADEASDDAPDPAEPTTERTDATPEPGQLTPADLPSEASLTRLEVQIEFVELVKQNRFEEALPLAEEIIPLTTAEFGSPSTELATALSNLAIVQRNLEDYEASKDTFLRAIDMYREVEGPYAESVISPLISLGANYRATGDYAQALGLFQEARTVNRRSFGLLNPDQVDIVYHIAATLASMQQYEEAQMQQEDALRLMERVYGTDTMEVLPYIYEYAEWLVSTFQFEPARVQYVRAMDIIRARDDEESIELVEPLTEIGNSYRVQKLAEGRGISALKRALEIAEERRDEDPVALARVLRDIGDWYTAFSRIGATGEEYERAWQILGEVDNGEELREAWFAEPNYVLREYPSNRGLAEPGDPNAVEGYVRVIFDVDAAGEALNVRVLEADPPEFKDTTMVRSIRRSRFRPRVVDGELVYSSGLIRNFTFHYVPEE